MAFGTWPRYCKTSCRSIPIQNQNPQAKKILNRIKKLAKQVNQITESEQKEINSLTKIKENGKSSDEPKEKLETQIHLLDKKIRTKSRPFSDKINDLNIALRDIPEIRKKLNTVIPLSKKIVKNTANLRNLSIR